MPFSDPILGGSGTLIRSAIRSPNYAVGVSGWSINKSGSAEFNNVTVRGPVIATSFATGVPNNARVEIQNASLGQVRIYAQGATFASLVLNGTFGGIGSQFVGAMESEDVHPTYGKPGVQLWTDPTGATLPFVQMVIPTKGLNTGGWILLGANTPNAFLELHNNTAHIQMQASGNIDVLCANGNQITVQNSGGAFVNLQANYAAISRGGAGSYFLSFDATGLATLAGAGVSIANVGPTASMTVPSGASAIAFTPSVKIPSGAAGTPTLFLDDGTTTSGMFSAGVGDVSLTGGGTRAFGINSTQVNALVKLLIWAGCRGFGLPTSAVAGTPIHYGTGATFDELYRFTSSGRYKSGISDPTPKTIADKLAALRVREYQPLTNDGGPLVDPDGTPVPYDRQKLRPAGSRRLGLIAEEVAAVAPEWVLTGGDGAPAGIDTEQLVSCLVLAYQQLAKATRQ